MRSAILLTTALIVLTTAVYWQVGSHEFVSLDDGLFITDNVHVATGITKENLLWALSPQPGSGWHPVTWLSHMLDVELYGLNPRGHHLTNVAVHLVATLVLFLLLFRTTFASWPSAFVAALFALHPLHVESVAWMAERRDVLSACFGFLALWLYAEYVLQNRRRFYLLALLAFVLGLMSKPMLVTLPFLMLLLDYWPLNRYGVAGNQHGQPARLVALLKEKLPFFAAALASAVITLSVPPLVEPLADSTAIPLELRLANAVIAYVKYLGKMVWPTDLAVFYPFPASISFWQVIGSLLTLLATTAATLRFRKGHPYLAVGWLWYLVTLVPVLGVIEFANHAMADRYTYIPLTGVFIAVAWGVPALTSTFPQQKILLAFSACAVLTILTTLTWRQLATWKDNYSLFQHGAEVTQGNIRMLHNYGVELAKKKRFDEAIEQFRKVLAISPSDIMAQFSLGIALAEKGMYEEAIVEYRKTLEIYPDYSLAHNYLGNALAKKGHFDEAIEEFRKALFINPGDVQAYQNLTRAIELKKMEKDVP